MKVRTPLVAGLIAVLVVVFPTAPTATAAAGAAPWDPWRAHLESGATVSLATVPTTGHVRYVAANGNNKASGRAPSPWKTVRHAIANAPAGSTIVIYGKHRGHGNGVYAEQDWGAIETAELTIQAYPGEQPIFKGSRAMSTKRGAWKRGDAGWYQDVGVADEWPENPFPIADQVTPERPQADDPAQVFVGEDLTSARPLDEMDRSQWDATEDAAGDHHVPPGRFFLELPAGRLWLGGDPRGQLVEWSTRQRAVQIGPGGRGARIIGISFMNYSPYHGNTLGTVRILASGVELTDVSVTNSAATGIAASGENGTLDGPLRDLVLRRVTASNNGSLGAAIGDANGEGADPDIHNHISIEYSRFDHNNREGFDVTDCGNGSNCAIAGIKLVRLNGLSVRYTSVDGNDSNGLWCDLYCKRVTILGNYIAGNTMSGIFYEVSGRATIDSNLIAANSTVDTERGPGAVRAAAIKVTGSTGVVIQHNTLRDNRRRQIYVAADSRVDEEPSVKLVDNRFVGVSWLRSIFTPR